MPAAVAKSILLSIGIIAALGLAVMENPQVQEWLEQQRKKIIELLKTIGSELDPESRRAAEAFAFEGRTAQNDPSIRREAEASIEAAAVATGRSMSNPSAIRRIPISGPTDPEMARERKMMGQAYLVQREQQMMEMQQRRSLASLNEFKPPSRTPSFDALVDDDGHLLTETHDAAPVTVEELPEQIRAEARQVEQHLDAPLAMAASSSVVATSAFAMGSAFANPFSDEYELERSITPRPPAVPPKVALSDAPDPEISIPEPQPAVTASSSMPGAFVVNDEENDDELTYEEQLAIALSLSEQESSQPSATVRQTQAHDDAHEEEIRAAIAASLRDMDGQQAAHAVAHAQMDSSSLIDFSGPSESAAAPSMHQLRNPWDTLLASRSPIQRPRELMAPSGTRIGFPGMTTYPGQQYAPTQSVAASEASSDDLYRITPQHTLTRAHLASLEASHLSDGTAAWRSAFIAEPEPEAEAMDSSFYSAISPATARSQTIDHEASVPPSLIDAPLAEEEDDLLAPPSGAQTPTDAGHSNRSLGFHPDAVVVATEPEDAQLDARSETSTIEVVDVAEGDDSDVDLSSEEGGDGIRTPDSWSEVDEHEASESSVLGDADHLHENTLVGA